MAWTVKPTFYLANGNQTGKDNGRYFCLEKVNTVSILQRGM